jgi:hypothetical protein
MVRFTPRPHYPHGSSSRYPFDETLSTKYEVRRVLFPSLTVQYLNPTRAVQIPSVYVPPLRSEFNIPIITIAAGK